MKKTITQFQDKLTKEEAEWLEEAEILDTEIGADEVAMILHFEYYRHNRSLHEANQMFERLTK